MNLNKKINISLSIRKILKTKNVSQKEVAEKIGFSVPAFSNALKRNDFKVSVLEKIAKVLEVPVSYFFDESSHGVNIQNVGNGNTGNVSILNTENERLKDKVASLEREIELLKEMVEMFKKWGVMQSFDPKTGKKIFYSGGKFFDPDDLEK